MTMRKLTEDELVKTNNGIERIDKEVAELVDSIEFNERTIEFQKAQAEYQDYVRPYLKKKKEIEDDKTMSLMRQDLNSKRDIVKNLKEQVEKGVEIKNTGD